MTDEPAGEPTHMWRLVEVELGEGATSTYECDLCDEVLVVPPGGVHPEEC